MTNKGTADAKMPCTFSSSNPGIMREADQESYRFKRPRTCKYAKDQLECVLWL